MPTQPITLHGNPLSGHSHRVELLLRMLGLPYRFIEAPQELRNTTQFRELNPLGEIPVIRDGEVTLADSNAILVYLAKGYAPGSHWLPEDPVAAAHVQRWLSIAAGQVMYGPAVARRVIQWQYPTDLAAAHKIAGVLLAFMNQHLSGRSYLAAEHVTIADLACYSYVAHAPEGGISLLAFPHVQAWLRRIKALPKFAPMPVSPIPIAPVATSPIAVPPVTAQPRS
jgi:glutathione S-transferase